MGQLSEHAWPKVLVVDDESALRGLLVRWLSGAGYCCLEAANTDEAWDCLQAQEIGLVTLDVSMPGGSGLQLLDRIGAANPDTAVIMVTGEGGTADAIQALTSGACGYLIKPVEREELLFHVRRGLEQRAWIREKREYTAQLELRVREQTDEIRLAYEETVHRLVAASEHRDEETGEHIRRTGLLSQALARAAGWEAGLAERLRMAAPMHDVGKIGIPDAILRKPGPLEPAEFEIMKQHTTIGAQILAGSKSAVLQMARAIALCHHEKWDGGGYPSGVAGEAIPQSARIVAIVDAYDALTHDRVYRPAFSEAAAVAMMLENAGKHFDPRLFEVFLSILPEMREISQRHVDEPRRPHAPQPDWPVAAAAAPGGAGSQNGGHAGPLGTVPTAESHAARRGKLRPGPGLGLAGRAEA